MKTLILTLFLIPCLAYSQSPTSQPTIDKKYVILNSIDFGMTMADMAATHECISDHKCKEGNPLMPSSVAGQVGINIGFLSYSLGASYYLKKHHSKLWWLPPVSGIVAHTLGFSSALRFK